MQRERDAETRRRKDARTRRQPRRQDVETQKHQRESAHRHRGNEAGRGHGAVQAAGSQQPPRSREELVDLMGSIFERPRPSQEGACGSIPCGRACPHAANVRKRHGGCSEIARPTFRTVLCLFTLHPTRPAHAACPPVPHRRCPRGRPGCAHARPAAHPSCRAPAPRTRPPAHRPHTCSCPKVWTRTRTGASTATSSPMRPLAYTVSCISGYVKGPLKILHASDRQDHLCNSRFPSDTLL